MPAPNRILAALFLLLVLPLGLFMACVVPLGQVADEADHAERAEGLLHGELLGHHLPQPGGSPSVASGAIVMVDLGLAAATHDTRDPRTVTGAELLARRAVPWRGVLTPLKLASASYWPVFYVPAAAAIGVVKLLGGWPFLAFRAARLANLAGFVLAGAAALWFARRGQALLFCGLTLPMTLNLAASVNPDGLMIACCALAAALLTRAAARGAAYWVAAVLLAGVAMLKPPYTPLAVLLLLPLPPLPQWRTQRRALAGRPAAAMLVVLAAATWSGIAASRAINPNIFPVPYEAGPLFAGARPALFNGSDPAAQATVLWTDPTRLVTLPVTSLLVDGTWLLQSGIGILGWLNVFLPNWMYTLWEAALVAAILIELLPCKASGDGAMVLETPLLLLALAASVLGVYLSVYLMWTGVGATLIKGAQGRYWLPLLPLLALALPRLGQPGGRALGAVLWLLPLAASGANLLMLPQVIVEHYYIP